jgi:hypothetical protein
MVRLVDLPPAQAQRLAAFDCPNFTTEPWVDGPPLSRRRLPQPRYPAGSIRVSNLVRCLVPDKPWERQREKCAPTYLAARERDCICL